MTYRDIPWRVVHLEPRDVLSRVRARPLARRPRAVERGPQRAELPVLALERAVVRVGLARAAVRPSVSVRPFDRPRGTTLSLTAVKKKETRRSSSRMTLLLM